MEIVQELTELIARKGTRELVDRAGLDPATAARAVPAGLEVILDRLGGDGKDGLMEKGLGALGTLLGGDTPSLPDHQGAVAELASRLGVGAEKAGGILSVLLPLVMQALRDKGGSGGSPLGALGKLFG